MSFQSATKTLPSFLARLCYVLAWCCFSDLPLWVLPCRPLPKTNLPPTTWAYRSKRFIQIVWALSAAIATTAGILVAPVSLIDPMMGFIAVKAFAAAIVGGFGNLIGAMMGGLLIGIVEQFAGLYLPTGFSDTSAYVILLLMLLVRRRKVFFSTIQRKKV